MIERRDSIDWGGIIDDLPMSPGARCSYFKDRISHVQFFLGDREIPADLQEIAMAAGFRRCGDTYYRAACAKCTRCIPYRIPTATFRPSRNQQRVLQRNREVEIRVDVPRCTPEKRRMYLRYQYEQHFQRPAFGLPEEGRDFAAAEAMETLHYQMYSNPGTTQELEMWMTGRLLGFGIMDVAEKSSSLVYFVFDPAHGKRSLGTLNILKSIAWADQQGLAYVYLGYYIPNHPKMSYKHRFIPAEMFCRDTGEWHRDLPLRLDPTMGKEEDSK